MLTTDRRICILHGRPVSISKLEVDAGQPTDFPALKSENRPDTFPNILAMINLTALFEEARDKMWGPYLRARGPTFLGSTASSADRCNSFHMRRAPKKSRAGILASISQLEQDLVQYWDALPTTTYCRDLTPRCPLFRFNIHLALTYHLAHVFVGRAFLFCSLGTYEVGTPSTNSQSDPSAIRSVLVSSCVESALEIIALCQILQDEVGLARASYTEFTSCRAALLVILAQRIYAQSPRLRRASEQGINLLKHTSVGFYAAYADKSVIEAMERAVRRLDSGVGSQIVRRTDPPGSPNTAYKQFRNWAMLWKSEGTSQTGETQPSSSTFSTGFVDVLETPNFSDLSPLPDLGWDML